jgi:hypothetical protein
MNVNIIRHDYTLLAWLAILGGLQGAFGSYFARVALGVSRRMFMDSVLKDIFYIKKRTSDDEEGGDVIIEQVADKKEVSESSMSISGGDLEE